MDDAPVLSERRPSYRVVTLNRPRYLNTFNETMHRASEARSPRPRRIATAAHCYSVARALPSARGRTCGSVSPPTAQRSCSATPPKSFAIHWCVSCALCPFRHCDSQRCRGRGARSTPFARLRRRRACIPAKSAPGLRRPQGALGCAAQSRARRGEDNHLFRGGIWMSSASCSLLRGASMNLSLTASLWMPAMSFISSVCKASLG
jgi:hypothetical protein